MRTAPVTDRRGGLIRERGLMACAMAGNIMTAWSWFGTNMLGIGLKSWAERRWLDVPPLE